MRSARPNVIVINLSTATMAVSRKIRGISRRTSRKGERSWSWDLMRSDGEVEDSPFLFESYLIQRHVPSWETISLRFSPILLMLVFICTRHYLGVRRLALCGSYRMVSESWMEKTRRVDYMCFSLFFYPNHLYSFHELHATCCRSSLIVVSIVPCVFLFQWMLAARTAWPPRRCVNS